MTMPVHFAKRLWGKNYGWVLNRVGESIYRNDCQGARRYKFYGYGD